MAKRLLLNSKPSHALPCLQLSLMPCHHCFQYEEQSSLARHSRLFRFQPHFSSLAAHLHAHLPHTCTCMHAKMCTHCAPIRPNFCFWNVLPSVSPPWSLCFSPCLEHPIYLQPESRLEHRLREGKDSIFAAVFLVQSLV